MPRWPLPNCGDRYTVVIGHNARGAACVARRAELSCDRAALLVTQDQHVIGRTMMKLCGGTFASKMDYEQFLVQARDFQENYDQKALDRFGRYRFVRMTHPFPVWRVSEISEVGRYVIIKRC